MKAVRLSNLVGLKDRLHHKPGELSGGQKQRIAIARSLIENQSVILVSEPAGILDTKTSADIIDIMLCLIKKNEKKLILAAHNCRLAEELRRVSYFCDGRLSSVCPEGF